MSMTDREPRTESTSDEAASESLRWLLRLRWIALVGQLATIALSKFFVSIELWVPGLVIGLTATALSNLLLHCYKTTWVRAAPRIILFYLALDVVTLTAMLYWSGGVHNPFTSFYLLHITIAAVLLPRSRAVLLSLLAFGGFGLLYATGEQSCHAIPLSSGISQEAHFQGMLVAFILTGTCIALFVGRLQAELRRHADALIQSRLRLAEVEHFSSLATLAAGVAHELATPLGTIAIASRELENTTRTQCQSLACLEDARLIRTEIDRCRTIIDRLGHGADRGAVPVTEALSAAAIMDRLRANLPPAHAARLSIVVETTCTIHTTSELIQSLNTLVKNACEADSEGHPVEVRVYEQKEWLSFEVRDRGAGMDDATRSRVGEPFFTTKPQGQGMGLGLFLVRMFATRNGGRLEMDSHPGKGCCMTLRLPTTTRV
ncbi:MAG: ATP-binding protein [Verrucomicrobiota bacterium]|nr:ATP-binding protein [Verrucomicrobiota bacterium]